MSKEKPEVIEPDLVEQQNEIAELVDEGQTQYLAPTTMPTAQSVHPGAMIQSLMASHRDIDIAQMQGLFDLQKQYDDEIARKAYHAAKAQFAAMAPTISHDGKVAFKSTKYTFASLASTMDQIREALQHCSLHASWKLTETETGQVRVTCYLTHELGYQEETSLSADRGAGKGETGMNSLQAVKSTVSYLERITLYALLGLASKEDDNDGQHGGDTPPPALITEEQALLIHSKITDNDLNMETFLNWLATSGVRASKIEDIRADYFDRVMKKIDVTIKAVAAA